MLITKQMRQVDWADVQHLLSPFPSTFFGVKLLYDYGLCWQVLLKTVNNAVDDCVQQIVEILRQNVSIIANQIPCYKPGDQWKTLLIADPGGAQKCTIELNIELNDFLYSSLCSKWDA